MSAFGASMVDFRSTLLGSDTTKPGSGAKSLARLSIAAHRNRCGSRRRPVEHRLYRLRVRLEGSR